MCKTDTFLILDILIIFTSDFWSVLIGILEIFYVNKKIPFFLGKKVPYFLHKNWVLYIIITVYFILYYNQNGIRRRKNIKS